MDPLSQTVALLRPRALIWKRLDAKGPWCLEFPANDGLVFCLVISGECQFESPARFAAPRRLVAGDFLFIREPSVWTLGDGSGASPVPRSSLGIAPDGVARIGKGRGPVTAVLGGHVTIDHTNRALLNDCLPDLLMIGSGEGGRLRTLLNLLGEEATADRPGADLVLERLLEITLVEAIRHGSKTTGGQGNLLAGLSDPRIAASLRALHGNIRHPWTVASLARTAHTSRSVFAARFHRVMGESPIRYLLRWRMALAKDALVAGHEPLTHIASACGYQSVNAFSSAFTREVGCPPSAFARREPMANGRFLNKKSRGKAEEREPTGKHINQ